MSRGNGRCMTRIKYRWLRNKSFDENIRRVPHSSSYDKILIFINFLIFVGHTSVSMCERMMANIQIIEATRKAFMSKKAFDVHPTKKHSEQDPFPDQLKGMWFCMKEEVLSPTEGRNVIKHFPLDGSGPKEMPIPKKFSDVYQKGCEKVEKEFNAKLHECFPSVRNVGST
jgi:hypothetical protein